MSLFFGNCIPCLIYSEIKIVWWWHHGVKSESINELLTVNKGSIYCMGQNYEFFCYAKNHYDIKIMFHEDILYRKYIKT